MGAVLGASHVPFLCLCLSSLSLSLSLSLCLSRFFLSNHVCDDHSCDTCDGSRNSAGGIDGTVVKFLYKVMNNTELRAKKIAIPNAFVPAAGDMTLDPSFPAKIVSNCGKLGKPTICDPRLRTVRRPR